MKRLISILLLAMMAGASYAAEKRQDDADQPVPDIIVRHAVVHGQIFIASEKEGEDDRPAEGVKVNVYDLPETNLICSAVTDNEGKYSLPMMPPEYYRLVIGGLRLRCRVTPEAAASGELPKVIIMILPKPMITGEPEKKRD